MSGDVLVLEPALNTKRLAFDLAVLEERRDLLHEVVEAALEDVALVRAIAEGESTELIKREAVFILKRLRRVEG